MTPLKPKESASVGLEPPVPAPRGTWAKLWPWLVSLAILYFLFTRIPRKALFNALEAGPWFSLGAYSFFQVVLVLLADAYATSVSLAITGFRQRFSLIFLARGASYILGILNYALGQGAFGLYLQRSGIGTMRAAGTMLFLMIVSLGVLLFVASFGLMADGYPGSSHLTLSPRATDCCLGCALSRHYLVTPALLAKVSIAGPLTGSGPERTFVGGWREAAPCSTPGSRLLGGFASLGYPRSPGAGTGNGALGSAHWRSAYHSRRSGDHPGRSGIAVQPIMFPPPARRSGPRQCWPSV